jgi:O-antigen biosynthesis protein
MSTTEHELAAQCEQLKADLAAANRERAQLQATVDSVLSSRAWRLAEKCRGPLRKIRRDWPRLYAAALFIAKKGSGLSSVQAQRASDPLYEQQTSLTEGVTSGASRSAALECGRASDPAYQRWIDEYEPTAEELYGQRERENSWADRPAFSIVLSLCGDDSTTLQNCVRSILQQTYTRWELCVASDPHAESANIEWLRELANQDDRVRVVEPDENCGVSVNSNPALRFATGEFVVVMDLNGSLAPFALFEVASYLRSKPDTDILYSDQDDLDLECGVRSTPFFKPDWSPEMMVSVNYVKPFMVLRQVLTKVGGSFNSVTKGAEDQDVFYRVTECTSNIGHIPKVLYHRRVHSASAAPDGFATPYDASLELSAIRSHMERCGIDAEPEITPDRLIRARFRRQPPSMVSIIIPTRDRVDSLSRCIASLVEHTEYERFEILIIDNASRESTAREYLQYVAKDERVRVLWQPGPFNYAALNNRGAWESRGELLLFLDDGVQITRPDWLSELASWANYKPAGIVGGKLLSGNGLIQHAGLILGMNGLADDAFAGDQELASGIAGSAGWYRNFLGVSGACMMMRREVFFDIGTFDETFRIHGADIDICLRARERGYRIIYNPFAEVIYNNHQAREIESDADNYKARFQRYRPWIVEGDPYWNVNLSLSSTQPTFRYANEASAVDVAEENLKTILTTPAPAPLPPSEEGWMVSQFDCTHEQFRFLREQNASVQGFRSVHSVLWYLPYFENPFYGGVFTILRFAEHWRRTRGVKSLFAICAPTDSDAMLARLRQIHPQLEDSHLFIVETPSRAADLPDVDASICTLWTTTYFALHHKRAARRFYLIQDYEPAFYRAGSASAIVESTYRMGLFGIANTISLKKTYESEYDGKAAYFKPSVDDSLFYPSPSRDSRHPERPRRIFLYGRPGQPRNAFELLIAAMRIVKEELGDRVRIFSAGSDWSPSEYRVQGIIENYGLLAYEDTARLYRETDVGVVMMLTRHPSYIPFELMACRCLVVTNVNPFTSWLLKDGVNCLLTQTTASAIAETVKRGILDDATRQSIIENALSLIRSEYSDWTAQMDSIYEYLCDPDTYLAVRDSHIHNLPHKSPSIRIHATAP